MLRQLWREWQSMIIVLAVILAMITLAAMFVESAPRGEQCIAGFVHWIDANANVRQIVDEHGHGIRCEVTR